MKKLYTLLLLLTATFLNAQIVVIPDINFKNALISEGVDTNNDGEIQVGEAEAVLDLNLVFKNILSMEGIQSFINLETLFCSSNQLSSLNMSQNLNLYLLSCGQNQISDLDVGQNLNLTTLVANNNQLSELDLSQNLILRLLACSNNQLSSLDLSHNINLEHLECMDNQLTSLFLNNGNNQNMSTMISSGNIDLTCIQVDDETANYPECGGFPIEGWCKDEWSMYNEDCTMGIADLNDFNFGLYPNPVKNELILMSAKNEAEIFQIKIFNITGKPLKAENLYFEKENSMDVSNFPSGIYFLNIADENGNVDVKKFVRE